MISLPVYATELREPSAIEVPTHYFGAPAVGVRNGEDLAKALRDAFRQLGPTVIEARVDVEQYDATVFD